MYYATTYDLIANLQYLSTTRLLFTNRGKRQEITNIITIEQVTHIWRGSFENT